MGLVSAYSGLQPYCTACTANLKSGNPKPDILSLITPNRKPYKPNPRDPKPSHVQEPQTLNLNCGILVGAGHGPEAQTPQARKSPTPERTP